MSAILRWTYSLWLNHTPNHIHSVGFDDVVGHEQRLVILLDGCENYVFVVAHVPSPLGYFVASDKASHWVAVESNEATIGDGQHSQRGRHLRHDDSIKFSDIVKNAVFECLYRTKFAKSNRSMVSLRGIFDQIFDQI